MDSWRTCDKCRITQQRRPPPCLTLICSEAIIILCLLADLTSRKTAIKWRQDLALTSSPLQWWWKCSKSIRSWPRRKKLPQRPNRPNSNSTRQLEQARILISIRTSSLLRKRREVKRSQLPPSRVVNLHRILLRTILVHAFTSKLCWKSGLQRSKNRPQPTHSSKKWRVRQPRERITQLPAKSSNSRKVPLLWCQRRPPRRRYSIEHHLWTKPQPRSKERQINLWWFKMEPRRHPPPKWITN